MIAITVSTNYHDILPYILEANLKHIIRWIFITDVNDSDTINLLTPYDKITILFWDFKNNGRSFDKGGAVNYAQKYAYTNYPNDWYILLDSDICLPKDFSIDISSLDENCMYGTDREYYNSASSYISNKPYLKSKIWPNHTLGFFQLYKKHIFYQSSNSAAHCDDEFARLLPNKILPIVCKHLGTISVNWKGRSVGSDFLIDI
jgi:hypothetical protein